MKQFRIIVAIMLLFACNKNDGATTINTDTSGFAKGADISWITEMEASGKKFYNAAGTGMDGIRLLQTLGVNSVRLRVWVNPADGWCNKNDLLVKAYRAKSLGMRIMVDFHYSDSWADPAQQTKPAAWANMSFNELKTAVADHTKEVLTLLKEKGITPEWVQVGNETGNGMLWDDGKASVNMANYAVLTSTGYDAVKAVFPAAKVIVHLQNGNDNSLFRWLFDGLKANGGKWDVIGMSLYPTKDNWEALNTACYQNMQDMIARYGSDVMICEVGMDQQQAAAAKAFLTDLVAKAKSISNNKVLGVFYWEPEAYGAWKNYTMGAFDDAGKPTQALDAFK